MPIFSGPVPSFKKFDLSSLKQSQNALIKLDKKFFKNVFMYIGGLSFLLLVYVPFFVKGIGERKCTCSGTGKGNVTGSLVVW